MSKDKPPSSEAKKSWWRQLKTTLSNSPQDSHALIEILRDSESRNIVNPDVLVMLEGAIHVSEMQVRDVMVPRVQMTVINHDAKPDEIIHIVIDSGHSRFPVVSDDQDDVLGILLAKDLLSCFVDNGANAFDIEDLMRPAVFTPESKRLNVLLRDFRTNRNHMAMVVDEYGIAGLVTIEDVIEEIIGEIEDEHDIDEEEYIRQDGSHLYTVEGFTPIDDFNHYFGTQIEDQDYDTVGGLITHAFGYLPKRSETIEFEGYQVKVLHADKRRVHSLQFKKADA